LNVKNVSSAFNTRAQHGKYIYDEGVRKAETTEEQNPFFVD
jgi:hypothetical protein